MGEYEKILLKHALRNTKPRRAVFLALKQATRPLRLSQVADRCPEIDRSSVYRTIDMFIEVGIVKIVHVGWKKEYELAELFSPHHHHFRCTSCHRIHHIADNRLEDVIEAISRTYSFTPTNHHFEIEGVCMECSAT